MEPNTKIWNDALARLTGNHHVAFSDKETEMLLTAIEQMDPMVLQSRVDTMEIVVNEMGLNATAVAAIMLQDQPEEASAVFGEQVAAIITGLGR
ncbi:MAG: hypothetical protein II692_03980, partial [Paludibacteraceae bacterium]|nr:hypothetical protein [Paludibacteraceae bacterium]